MGRFVSTYLLAFGVALGATAAHAQSSFSPAILVNTSAITHFEIQQRVNFLRAINTAGDLDQQATDALIDERLMMAAVTDAGIQLDDMDVEQEMQDFASRGRLSLEDFGALLAEDDVEFLSFRTFASVRVAWRDFIRTRFLAQVNVTQEEVDRALSQSGGGLRVLMSEIIMPVNADNRDQVFDFLREIKQTSQSTAAFERAARRYSAGPSRENSGRLDWLNLSELPGQIASAVIGLSPGEISEPLPVQQAIILLQLRAIGEAPVQQKQDAALEYMLLRLSDAGSPKTNAAIAKARAQTDTCSDFWAQGDDLPQEALTRQSLAPSAIPTRILAELNLLDAGEMSTRLTSPDGQESWVIMLCGRSPVIDDNQSRETVLNELRNRRIDQLANSYLAELRAAAQIINQ